MPLLNGGHLIWILMLVAVLVIFGPKRLPELGSAMGHTLREFRRATSDMRDHLNEPQPKSEEPPPAA